MTVQAGEYLPGQLPPALIVAISFSAEGGCTGGDRAAKQPYLRRGWPAMSSTPQPPGRFIKVSHQRLLAERHRTKRRQSRPRVTLRRIVQERRHLSNQFATPLWRRRPKLPRDLDLRWGTGGQAFLFRGVGSICCWLEHTSRASHLVSPSVHTGPMSRLCSQSPILPNPPRVSSELTARTQGGVELAAGKHSREAQRSRPKWKNSTSTCGAVHCLHWVHDARTCGVHGAALSGSTRLARLGLPLKSR